MHGSVVSASSQSGSSIERGTLPGETEGLPSEGSSGPVIGNEGFTGQREEKVIPGKKRLAHRRVDQRPSQPVEMRSPPPSAPSRRPVWLK